MTLTILADENMPYVTEAFQSFGTVHTLPGRAMTASDVRAADVLLVRSVTKVGAALVGDSALRFVGTATAGVDHIDQAFLARRTIPFASAPGSNAVSVADWVVAALLEYEVTCLDSVAGKTLGVVGVGQVGHRVAARGEALGMNVLLCDPPRARLEGAASFVDLDEICAQADVITLHVPMNRGGQDNTFHLLDGPRLASLKPDAVLLNSARGAVISGAALLDRQRRARLPFVALDVWEGEPAVDLTLMALVNVATPHIAGYAWDGKLRGTQMLHDALVGELGLQPAWSPADALPVQSLVDARRWDRRRLVRSVYDIMADDRRLRATRSLGPEQRRVAFDRLRKTYPRRREFGALPFVVSPEQQKPMESLGFALANSALSTGDSPL